MLAGTCFFDSHGGLSGLRPVKRAAHAICDDVRRAGDILVFTTFVAASKDESNAPKLRDLTVAYWVCICQAMLISLICLGHKFVSGWELLRARALSARSAFVDKKPTKREARLAKIAATKKTCISDVLAVLVALLEVCADTPTLHHRVAAQHRASICMAVLGCCQGLTDGNAHRYLCRADL